MIPDKNQWRLIPLICTDGKTQMAIDEWLLNQHQLHRHPPTLRFYQWNPVAISLGVSQKRHFPKHWESLTYENKTIDIVKRPTGGRGVLHQGDLTYCLVSSFDQGNSEQIYQQICQFLILSWYKLGIELKLAQPNRNYLKSPNCFALATSADLVDGEGRKFIGSAQLKRGKYILQHGSMLLNPDINLYQDVFGTMPSLVPLPKVTIDEIVTILTQTAEEYFNCQFLIQPLSREEWKEIISLISEK